MGGRGEAAEEEEEGGRGAPRFRVSGREASTENHVCRAAESVHDPGLGVGHLRLSARDRRHQPAGGFPGEELAAERPPVSAEHR